MSVRSYLAALSSALEGASMTTGAGEPMRSAQRDPHYPVALPAWRLFAVLSIIRLRSAELDQQEVAYYFAAMTLGLLGGLVLDPKSSDRTRRLVSRPEAVCRPTLPRGLWSGIPVPDAWWPAAGVRNQPVPPATTERHPHLAA